MHEYEIRILRADRSTSVVMETMQLNDNAAVRAGKKIAEARPFEVWRGLDCIYGSIRKPRLVVPTPPNAAA
jgi:hypothetical protein